VEVYFLVSK